MDTICSEQFFSLGLPRAQVWGKAGTFCISLSPLRKLGVKSPIERLTFLPTHSFKMESLFRTAPAPTATAVPPLENYISQRPSRVCVISERGFLLTKPALESPLWRRQHGGRAQCRCEPGGLCPGHQCYPGAALQREQGVRLPEGWHAEQGDAGGQGEGLHCAFPGQLAVCQPGPQVGTGPRDRGRRPARLPPCPDPTRVFPFRGCPAFPLLCLPPLQASAGPSGTSHPPPPPSRLSSLGLLVLAFSRRSGPLLWSFHSSPGDALFPWTSTFPLSLAGFSPVGPLCPTTPDQTVLIVPNGTRSALPEPKSTRSDSPRCLGPEPGMHQFHLVSPPNTTKQALICLFFLSAWSVLSLLLFCPFL